MNRTTRQVAEALTAQGWEAMYHEGRFAMRKPGDTKTTFATLAQARAMVGMSAPRREFRERVSAYGDWATVALMNRVKL